jgi:hypothetical protein
MSFARNIRRLWKRVIEGARCRSAWLADSHGTGYRSLEAQRHILSGRAAAIVVNTTIGAAIKNFIVTSTLVDGVTARSLHPNKGMARALEDGFARFQDECVLEGNMDLAAFTNLILSTVIVGGEAIVRDVVTPEGELRSASSRRAA